jgi:dynamin-binding protein
MQLSDVRKHVIEPFEQVIRCYGNPTLALKKRSKRRLDYDKHVQLKANGKKVDKSLTELVEQYEALNDTLTKELPKLSALTAKVGNICLGKFVSIQATWYLVWKEKVKAPLQDLGQVPELSEIVTTFQREFQLQEERASAIGILNPTLKGRTSQSTTDDTSSTLSKTRSRPENLLPSRGRGLSINSDHVPSLPTPDFAKRNSGQFSLSPSSPGHYYRDYYSGINGHTRGISGSPITPEPSSATRPTMGLARPSTGRSFESTSIPRQSSESAANATSQNWRDSNSTYNSNYPSTEARRLSGLFHSALPLPDGPEESMRSSRASSSERPGNGGYRVLWLAASLFEFNIETTKHEAGYPYLTYQAGEVRFHDSSRQVSC